MIYVSIIHVTLSMAKQIDYSIWLEENKYLLNNILKDIFKSINNADIPKSFNMDFRYKDELKDDLLWYIYMNSSSSIRKG